MSYGKPQHRLHLRVKRPTKYFVPAKELDFLFNYPQPNSLVVDAVQRRAKAPQYKNTLPDKDNKKLDIFGRKVYSSATLLLHIANYSAHLSNHNFDNYSKLVELLQHLPDNKKPLLKAIVQKGYASCSTALQIAMDVADTAARATATHIAMRKSSWLSSAGAPKEMQSKVEDLLFDKLKLFVANTDEFLHSGKDSRTTLRTLEMYTPSLKCRRYFPYQRKYDFNFSRHNHVPSTINTLDNIFSANDPNRAVRPIICQLSSKFDLFVKNASQLPAINTEDEIIQLFHDHLRSFYHCWSDITTDKWVLEVVQSGLSIPFLSIPPTTPPASSLFRDPSHDQLLQQEV